MLAKFKIYAIVGGIILAVMGIGWGVIQYQARKIDHLRVEAEANLNRAKAAEATVNERNRAISTLEESIRDERARVARFTDVRRAVEAAPSGRACAVSPSVRAALDGLRALAPDPAAPVNPTGTVRRGATPADSGRPR